MCACVFAANELCPKNNCIVYDENADKKLN